MNDEYLTARDLIYPESGYPIYLTFELIHVTRKTAFDFKEEQTRIAMKFKSYSSKPGVKQ